jgi:uncharacterized protein YbjQ (UPF0145 family)
MDPALVDTAVELGIPIALLVVTYLTGRFVEKRHYRDIRRREAELIMLPAVTFRQLPKGWSVDDVGMVMGSVVVSVDYFKRFLAGLRMFFGGRVKSYETLLDRARREALLRCKEKARASGYQAIVNVRLETSRLASARRDGKATAGVEVLAFGTGLKIQGDLR